MPAYTPTEFTKDGVTKIAESWSEHYQFIWDGWHVVGEAPEPPASTIGATQADLDDLRDEILADVVQLKQLARNPDMLIVGTITRDANGAATSAPVEWPDGASGVYTADTVSSAFPGAVDAYHITKVGSPTLTFTQPAVTRNSVGAVTNCPEIVVT